MFDTVLTDRVTIRTGDGKAYPDVRASVQPRKILVSRADIPIRPGDHVVRTTPAGVEEVFVVEDPGFQPGLLGAIPPHYQMRVRRTDALPPASHGARIVYNITGPNARFNINSTDASTNVVNQAPAELFASLRAAIESGITDREAREALLARAAVLEAEANTKTFGRRYAEFMALAASHFEVVGPFVPALAQLLS